ncbi:hypothetical protein FOCC_FOCC015923 [Frankliniella occidentalis]|nr:hypothetical protein FOCC_FOCC015923 [Frankliniella occidentalis]
MVRGPGSTIHPARRSVVAASASDQVSVNNHNFECPALCPLSSSLNRLSLTGPIG